MKVRFYQTGDEIAQLKIYNAAGAGLTKFKPATPVELQRRVQATDFDPGTRLYAEIGGNVVGYCSFQVNGRIGYPWCLPGHESIAEPLFAQTLEAMKRRGLAKAFSAYRKDWPAINAFFQNHKFTLAREMVNYVLAFENMPTASARLTSAIGPATVDDLPAIFALDPGVFGVKSAEALRDALWNNPRIPFESLFVLRSRTDQTPIAAGILITNADYADARAVDSAMPCFRLGAFGTEGMTAKRIKGLFSFVTRPDRNLMPIGMDLLGWAANRLTDDDDITCYAAQVSSDATALMAFYERVFERQGSFPVYERILDS